MKKLSTTLYGIARKIGKTASKLNDIETLLSGNPKKIAKRAGRKAVNKTVNKFSRGINNKLFK